MKKVLITFTRYSAPVLLKIQRNTIAKCTGNANFPNLTPKVPDMEILANEFEAAITAAEGGDRIAIAHKRAVMVRVAASLRDWAIYVNMMSKEDGEKIASSGLPVAKTPEPTKIAAPANIKVLQGLNPGAVIIKFAKVKGAISYLYEWTTDPLDKANVWQSEPGTITKLELQDLEEGKKYWFRITAIGSNKQKAISREVSQYVMQRSEDLAA